jgi:alpha-ketoglutarate-dependent taurine dioxygenase
VDVSWQQFFHTSKRADVEAFCRKAGIHYEWKPKNGLKTSKKCPAVIRHPQSGEKVFFNQIALHHISTLDPETRSSMLSLFGLEGMPRNVYFGDGSVIEDAMVDEILAVLDETSISFPWQEGDTMMLDNMLTAHARNPFVGERKIVVAMSEIVHELDVERIVA